MEHLGSHAHGVSARPASSAARPSTTTKQRGSLPVAWNARRGRVTTELVSFVRWACCGVLCTTGKCSIEMRTLTGTSRSGTPRWSRTCSECGPASSAARPPATTKQQASLREAWYARYGRLTTELVSFVLWACCGVCSVLNRNMFFGAAAFNADLSKWDTSKVTTME